MREVLQSQHNRQIWMYVLDSASGRLSCRNDLLGATDGPRPRLELLRAPRMAHLLESSPWGRRFVSRTEPPEEVPEGNEGRSDVDLRSLALTAALGNPSAHDSRFVPA